MLKSRYAKRIETAVRFSRVLTKLTQIDRARLTELRNLAKEFINYASIIVNLIKQWLENAAEKQELAVLFLIHDILGNVGGQYGELLIEIVGIDYLLARITALKLK